MSTDATEAQAHPWSTPSMKLGTCHFCIYGSWPAIQAIPRGYVAWLDSANGATIGRIARTG